MLEIGKEYRNYRGERVIIGGLTADNPQWVWSTTGNWYERATGLFLWYNPKAGTHVTRTLPGQKAGPDINMGF